MDNWKITFDEQLNRDTDVVFRFETQEIRDWFLGWMCDGGGEQGLMEAADICGHPINHMDYRGTFTAWGYDGTHTPLVMPRAEMPQAWWDEMTRRQKEWRDKHG